MVRRHNNGVEQLFKDSESRHVTPGQERQTDKGLDGQTDTDLDAEGGKRGLASRNAARHGMINSNMSISFGRVEGALEAAEVCMYACMHVCMYVFVCMYLGMQLDMG